MKQRIAMFMAGRNGADQLSRFMVMASLVLLVLSTLFRGSVIGSALWILGLAAIIYSYMRMFSKNIAKRREENAKYLTAAGKVRAAAAAKKARRAMRKDYCFFKCTSCKTMLRVPRGKGRILVRCSKCGQSFERKT